MLSTNVAAVPLALVLGVADTFKERGQDNALVAPIATYAVVDRSLSSLRFGRRWGFSAFLIASGRVRDLLFRAKHLFVVAIEGEMKEAAPRGREPPSRPASS